MMRFKKAVIPLTLLLFAVLLTALPAQAKMKQVPKIDNFVLFIDYSGSMMMHSKKTGIIKEAMAKDAAAKINAMIPALGYKSALDTFAPFSEIVRMGPYNKQSIANGIATLRTDQEIFQRLTPMGNGIAALRPVLDTLTGKTAIILFTDGGWNLGRDPVAEAKAIYASYPNVCFHVVSFADDAFGKQINEAIASLSPCSCPIVDGSMICQSEAMLNDFVKCVFYDLVNVCDGEVIMFRSVQFDSDRSFIKAEMMPILDEAARIMKENDCGYMIEGHTCIIGSASYNQGLSERRAASVKKYLVEKGMVDGSKLQTIGYGLTRPKYDNKTREGRRLNRRVEIKVMSN
jgi:OOP family OmpA-OmpF porin